jgi:molybdenum cofactor cytidylyltransferase
MGTPGAHKLLSEFDGIPLVRRAALCALAADTDAVVVVTGHRHAEIEDALSGLDIAIVENPDYLSGMAGSLMTGLRMPSVTQAAGMLVMLADMPGVTAADLNVLIKAFKATSCQAIVRAVSGGKRGNPVILPQLLYNAVMQLAGDTGARHLIETSGLSIVEVEIGEAAHVDVDTVEEVIAAGGILRE